MEADGNTDNCCLCNQGGSLLCCDGCPASYHLRCIGEQAKSLPEGEWLCPECALGGRGGQPSCRPLKLPCPRSLLRSLSGSVSRHISF